MFIGEGIGGEVEAGEASMSYGANVGDVEVMNVCSVGRNVGVEDIVLAHGIAELLGGHAFFGGEFDIKERGSGGVKAIKLDKNVIIGENRDAIDGDDAGVADFVGGGFMRRKHFGGTAVIPDVGDEGAIIDVVGGNCEAKQRGAARWD